VISFPGPYQQRAFVLSGFWHDPDLDFTELTLGLSYRGIVTDGVSGADLVDQLRQLRADLLFAGLHYLAAGTFRIPVGVARRVALARQGKHRILAVGRNSYVGKGAALQQSTNHDSCFKYLPECVFLRVQPSWGNVGHVVREPDDGSSAVGVSCSAQLSG